MPGCVCWGGPPCGAAAGRRPAWAQRLFAALTAAGDAGNDRLLGTRKRALLGDLGGDVVELGPGTGVNLPYFRSDVRWTGVEPNPYMHPRLREKAGRLGRSIVLHPGTAECTGLAHGVADAVVATLVLCTVGDVRAALSEVRRLLRPGGRFVFLEHVAAPAGTGLRRAQGAVRPLWAALADGCHPDRETWTAIESAGFSGLRYDRFRIDVPPPLAFLSPAIAGSAIA
jgi:SAM-dependent methyltransferase